MRRDGLVVEVLESTARVRALEPAWNRLLERCPGATPFQSPEWILACWRYLDRDSRRALLAVRSGSELVGVVPLRWRTDECITLEGEEVSDYLDVVAAPGHRSGVVSALLGYLEGHRGAVRCAFERLEPRSPLLEKAPPLGWWSRVEEHDICPYLAIPPGTRDAAAVVPAAFWKHVRRSQRMVERQGYALRLADPTNAESMLARLFELHASRWRTRGQSGVLAEASIRAFHGDAAPRLLARGRLWLLELLIDGTPAAASYVLLAPPRALYYIGGFEPDFARWSPGRLALAGVLQRAARSGLTEVDLLRGVESYKYDWGARNRSTCRLHLERFLKERTAWIDGSA